MARNSKESIRLKVPPRETAYFKQALISIAFDSFESEIAVLFEKWINNNRPIVNFIVSAFGSAEYCI